MGYSFGGFYQRGDFLSLSKIGKNWRTQKQWVFNGALLLWTSFDGNLGDSRLFSKSSHLSHLKEEWMNVTILTSLLSSSLLPSPSPSPCPVFPPLFSRNLLHHLTVHLCGWDQLWVITLPTLPIWTSRWHQPRLWMVHVLCMGGPGPHANLGILLYLGPLCPTCPEDQLP